MKRLLCALVILLAASVLLPAASWAVQVTFSWTDGVTGEDGRRIDRRDGPDAAPWVVQGAVVPAGTNVFQQTGLAVGIRYCYRETPVSQFGDGQTGPILCGSADVPSGADSGFTLIFAK